MKKILIFLLIPVLVLDVLTSTNLAFGEYNGIYDDDLFYCVKGCRLSRVWGTEWIAQGNVLHIVSCPWTAGGTFDGEVFEWDGKYPMVEGRNFKWKSYSWFYERTGPVSRSQGCHYRRLSNFLKDRSEWIYPLPNF